MEIIVYSAAVLQNMNAQKRVPTKLQNVLSQII